MIKEASFEDANDKCEPLPLTYKRQVSWGVANSVSTDTIAENMPVAIANALCNDLMVMNQRYLKTLNVILSSSSIHL